MGKLSRSKTCHPLLFGLEGCKESFSTKKNTNLNFYFNEHLLGFLISILMNLNILVSFCITNDNFLLILRNLKLDVTLDIEI